MCSSDSKFRKLLLSSNESTTQNLDALAVVVPEISSRELKSNLAFILTLSVSKPDAVQTTNFRQMVVSSSQSTTQNLDALNYILFFFYIKTNIYFQSKWIFLLRKLLTTTTHSTCLI